MTDKAFNPENAERITGFPDTYCSENIVLSEPLVRAFDYDRLLELYRELVPLRICALCGKDAKDSKVRITGTKEPVCMDCWNSM